jgi:signal peptidase I
MGDNRDDSLDSRFWGFVPFNHILGEALFVYFSLDLDDWFPRFNRIATVLK